jgi:epoxyqueuosine reductase
VTGGSIVIDLRRFIEGLDVDLYGFANLDTLRGIPTGSPCILSDLWKTYRSAIVLGTRFGNPASPASGFEAAVHLEAHALRVLDFFEERNQRALIVHTEDEFDATNRIGLLSLKALAKAAGLGWQGRSLLIVSPLFGPLRRLIVILTEVQLPPDQPIASRCGECSLCIEKCTQNALTYVPFTDHPPGRDDVLDVRSCRGDAGCSVCIAVCPWPTLLTSSD